MISPLRVRRQDGKTGFDVLVLKHRNGKEIFKEMAEFLKQRAIIEDTYAKSMQKLSRSQDKYGNSDLIFGRFARFSLPHRSPRAS